MPRTLPKKNSVRVLEWRPNRPYHCTPLRRCPLLVLACVSGGALTPVPPPPPPLFSHSISDLNIRTFGPTFTGTPQTPLFTLLDTCVNRGISAVPIVNEDGRLLDVFSRYDVMNLAVEVCQRSGVGGGVPSALCWYVSGGGHWPPRGCRTTPSAFPCPVMKKTHQWGPTVSR